ncbi:hypothetical protein IMCC3317_37590 [Kordia antarctica]|uniref:Uncharacterized protein n=1 Tax=Kordia antarctica TaxID=1218801 RepID=A0A7L4ZPH2_9FLAO|nr:class I lanthipeptide [Kordia antarctica]QHI38367.1 hypothetical protein IMCC3317_37590 [Kordia antarctica]
MKKNKVNSKISITKSVIASLNEVDVRKIVGGANNTHIVCYNNTERCKLSNEISCYSPCGPGGFGTLACNPGTTNC